MKVRIDIEGPMAGAGTPPKYNARITDDSGAIVLHVMGIASLVSGTLQAWLCGIVVNEPVSSSRRRIAKPPLVATHVDEMPEA